MIRLLGFVLAALVPDASAGPPRSSQRRPTVRREFQREKPCPLTGRATGGENSPTGMRFPALMRLRAFLTQRLFHA